MKRLVAVLSVATVVLSIFSTAHAQIPGFGRASSDDSQSSSNLLESFSMSSKHNVDAQSHFAAALGLQDQVQLLQAEQSALSSGQIDQESTEKAISVSARAQEAIATRIASQPELSAEGKESYLQGLISYFLAIATARDVVTAAKEVGGSSLGNPLAAARQASSSIFVARQAPNYLKNLQENASMLIEFGQQNGIEPPENATALLDSL